MSKEELAVNIYAVSPALCCVISAVVILIISTLEKGASLNGRMDSYRAAGILAFFTFVTSSLISIGHLINIKGPLLLFKNAVIFDHYAAASVLFFSLMGCATLFIETDRKNSVSSYFFVPEYYALLLFAASGAMIMAVSNDLFSAFIGLEILSISTYILCALDKENKRAVEGAFKYFLMGAAAGAIFLFGLAHIYGGAGTTLIKDIIYGAALNGQNAGTQASLLIGLVFITSALLFKTAAVPFHGWAPDVYDAASLSVTAFMTYFVKAAIFILIFRIFASAFSFMASYISMAMVFIAVITMSVANIAALFQKNIKRMLAYSSISHTAYILIAVICVIPSFKNGVTDAGTYILFYLLSYFFINAAVFSAIGLLGGGRADVDIYTIDDLKGMGFVSPLYSALFSIALLALAGIPATSGFMAKFLIFYNAFLYNYYLLVLIAVINSFIAFYYYIKIIMSMYMYEPERLSHELPEIESSSCCHSLAFSNSIKPENAARAICLIAASFFVVAAGVYPAPFIEFLRNIVIKSF